MDTSDAYLTRCPWLRAFDAEDRREFAAELQQTESPAAIADILHRWRVIADQFADPQRRASLLARGELHEDDFIEVCRPED